jgi:hypothetical protein
VIPSLADLRTVILSLDRKRRPKWRFRLAPDLIVQLQPSDRQSRRVAAESWEARRVLSKEPSSIERYERFQALMVDVVVQLAGVAIVGPTDVTSFDGKPQTVMPWTRIQFIVDATQDGAWWIHAGGWRASRGRGAEIGTTWGRVRDALNLETFAIFRAELMLSSNCLCCGKKLTDPASLARWFGPECAGTSSLLVPRLYLPRLEAAS